MHAAVSVEVIDALHLTPPEVSSSVPIGVSFLVFSLVVRGALVVVDTSCVVRAAVGAAVSRGGAVETIGSALPGVGIVY